MVGGGSILFISYISKSLPEDILGLCYLLVVSSCTILLLFYMIVFSVEEKTFCKMKVKGFYKKLSS